MTARRWRGRLRSTKAIGRSQVSKRSTKASPNGAPATWATTRGLAPFHLFGGRQLARKRTIDPGIWADEDFCAVSQKARLLYLGLISQADDEGRLPGSPTELKHRLYPGAHDAITCEGVLSLLNELCAVHLIAVYKAPQKSYVALRGWGKNQTMSWATESKYPPPPDNAFSHTPLVDSSAVTVHTGPCGAPSLSLLVVDKEERDAVILTPLPAPLPDAEVLVTRWNADIAPLGPPKVLKVVGKRREKAQARIREGILGDWPVIVRVVTTQDNFRGNNKSGWFIDFDHLVDNPSNWVRIVERASAVTASPAKPETVQERIARVLGAAKAASNGGSAS